jgi:1,4-dihydroxy-2-naphthoate octaprenyltransferase
MSDFKSLLGPMRLSFIILTPICVLLGISTAYLETDNINWLFSILIIVGAVSAHISVNAFNEYFDFKSGLDLKTKRTPFSGGSGTLPKNPKMLRSTIYIAWISFLVTLFIGLYFVYSVGWELLPLGLFGLLMVYIYTKWITHNPLLCLIAPGLSFGILMVMGTHFVLTGHYSWIAFIASLIPFFLVNDLLLLNQFPDVLADKTVGRLHYPIAIGLKKSSKIYIVFLIIPYLILILAVVLNLLPVLSLLGLLTVFIAYPLSEGVLKNAEDIDKLIPYMGKNVLINLLFPALVAIGIFLS